MTEICRVCLRQSNTQNYKAISNNMEFRIRSDYIYMMTILEVLEKVVSKKIMCNEILPRHICPTCIDLLKVSFKFITKFEESQKELASKYSEHLNDYHINGTLVKVKCEPMDTMKEEYENVLCKAEIKSEYDINQQSLESDGLQNADEQTNNSKSKRNSVSLSNNSLITIKKELTYKEHNSSKRTKTKIISQKLDMKDKSKEVNNKLTSVKVKLKTERVISEKRRKLHSKEKVPPTADKSDKIFDNKIFPCGICKKLFDSKRKVLRHQREIHANPKEAYTCEICGFITRSKGNMIQHRLIHFEKTFHCDTCEKKFTTSQQLSNHMESHRNTRQHLCNICGKSFNYANALKYHLMIHNGEKNAECSYCSARFTRSCDLNRHIRSHTGEKPYKCQYCDTSFATKGQLKVHEYGHTGIRPFSCKYCQKGFTKSYNLKIHLFSHQGPHRCDICQKSFMESSILFMHSRIAHKDHLAEDSHDSS